HGIDVADLEEKAVLSIVDQLRHAAYAGGDSGNAARHGFERGKAEGLHLAGHEHQIGKREEFVDVVLLADEVNAILYIKLQREVLGGAAVGTIADQHQPHGHGSGDAGKDLHDILNALDGAEVGEMDEKPLVC